MFTCKFSVFANKKKGKSWCIEAFELLNVICVFGLEQLAKKQEKEEERYAH